MLAFAALVLVLAALAVYGAWRWAAGTRALFERLEAARVPPAPARYDAARELDGLPAPVHRYFRTVLADGQPIVAAVTVEHRGTFNMGETADQWKPFASQQRVVTRRPGFVWDGKVALLPGLNVHVHDAYVAGEGILHPAILGLFTLIDLRGTGDVAQGELMRFFAEAAWYPTALLPSQGVHWEPLDDRSARATLVDRPVADHDVHLRARWHDAQRSRRGAGTHGCRQDRHDALGGPLSDVQLRDGMRVPMTGEVAWLTPEGRKPYWRGTISSLRFEYAR